MSEQDLRERLLEVVDVLDRLVLEIKIRFAALEERIEALERREDATNAEIEEN